MFKEGERGEGRGREGKEGKQEGGGGRRERQRVRRERKRTENRGSGGGRVSHQVAHESSPWSRVAIVGAIGDRLYSAVEEPL